MASIKVTQTKVFFLIKNTLAKECQKKIQNSSFIQKIEMKHNILLIDFSLTVKATTLIFISGRGSAISSAKERKRNQVLYMIW